MRTNLTRRAIWLVCVTNTIPYCYLTGMDEKIKIINETSEYHMLIYVNKHVRDNRFVLEFE